MVSLLLGAIKEFDPTTEKTFDQLLFANNIGSYLAGSSEAVFAAEEKKNVAVMISVIGKKTSYFSICAVR